MAEEQFGNFLSINRLGKYKKEKYWSLQKNLKKNEYKNIKEEEITGELKILLNKVVKQHLISDVPIGSFLSGGIDSSTISLIASNHKKKINTYSAGYRGEKFFDETKPLGTVGGLKSHQKKFKDSFFVTNCDVFFDIKADKEIDINGSFKNISLTTN